MEALIWAVVGAVIGVLLAAVFEAVSGGWFRLQLYRLGRKLNWGPAPSLDVRVRPIPEAVDHPWAHIEVANGALRFPVTNDATGVRADAVLDGKRSVQLLWDALGPAVPKRTIARDEWATIPVAVRPRSVFNVGGCELQPGVTYLTDMQLLRQMNPSVLTPGEHTLDVTIRAHGDDPVAARFVLGVPEVGSNEALGLRQLPTAKG